MSDDDALLVSWMLTTDYRNIFKRERAARALAAELSCAIPDRRPDYCYHRWKQRRMAEQLEMRRPLCKIKRRR